MNTSSDTKEKLSRYAAMEEQLEIRNAEYNSRYISFNSELKEYNEKALEPCTIDGRIYGQPFGVNCTGMFYNKKLLEENGCEVPESWEEFVSVVDYIAKQVMPDVYPSNSYISGGGHLDFGFDLPSYMTFMIQNDNKDQYIHNIYVGEKYVYDFWFDTGWLADSGETIMSTISAEDIKPDLNQSDSWSIHDFPDFPGEPNR